MEWILIVCSLLNFFVPRNHYNYVPQIPQQNGYYYYQSPQVVPYTYGPQGTPVYYYGYPPTQGTYPPRY